MTKMSSLLAAASLFGSIAVATPASAATLLYSFTPTAGPLQAFSFNVDSNPVPATSTFFNFAVNVQNLTVGGIARSGTNSVTFLNGGGLRNGTTGDFTGARLYSGTTSAPTLSTGTFTLTASTAGSAGTLSVTSIAAIPEPATWAMMVVGLGLTASAMRRRKVTTRVSFAA